MQNVLCFIAEYITTAIKLAMLQPNERYHVHDPCQSA